MPSSAAKGQSTTVATAIHAASATAAAMKPE